MRRDAIVGAFIKSAGKSLGVGDGLMTPKNARAGREPLGFDHDEVADLSGLLAGVVVRIENGGRRTLCQCKALARFYELEGLIFSSDGGVAWAE